jgi:hypothetical protein
LRRFHAGFLEDAAPTIHLAADQFQHVLSALPVRLGHRCTDFGKALFLGWLDQRFL